LKPFFDRMRIHLAGLQTDLRTIKLARQVSRQSLLKGDSSPVIIFNASTRLNTLSQNAGFAMLAGWALQLSGNQVVHFVCHAGMSRCVLGTDEDDFSIGPPCRSCIRQSRLNTHAAVVQTFEYHDDDDMRILLDSLSLDELQSFERPLVDDCIPLGKLVLPSIRWRLRRSNLQDDKETRWLFRQYILSAWNVAREFMKVLKLNQPKAVLVFNGQFFPEAVICLLSRKHGVYTITHEVGMQPLSGFFTEGEATAYPVDMPEDYSLDLEQDTRLDTYLGKRMQGDFTMAGIRFWPEIKPLDQVFIKKSEQFKQIVPIFTNVIFDTSQPHSNTVFSDMFAWLDQVLLLIKAHPQTLFVLRAHPDEKRTGKSSMDSVSDWVTQYHADELGNLIFVDSLEYISSYDLIRRSKFIMIYNSTIGMEAAVMGKVVLAAGRSRFSPYQMVYFPQTPREYHSTAENFLTSDELEAPLKFRSNARRFLYYLLFCAVIPYNTFLEPSMVPGVVQLKRFSWLDIKRSQSLQAVVGGIIERKPFIFPQE
jgi:hypothetical protein